jgi:hypothetical protein
MTPATPVRAKNSMVFLERMISDKRWSLINVLPLNWRFEKAQNQMDANSQAG